jgi:sigma-B regulation protein RsbU (phosphoserine phosphatase)
MPRLLVIDDHATLRAAVARGLERAGHEVVQAGSGTEGMAELEGGPFDLVVTDINMPDMDGIEVILKLSQIYPDLPVIAVSGGGLMSHEILLGNADALGAVDVLAKPFELAELNAIIDRALNT